MCTGLEPEALMALIGGLGEGAAAVAPEAAGSGLMGGLYSSLLPGMGAEQAAALAAQTGDFGLLGLGKTMEAAAGAQGLNPLQAAAGKSFGGVLSGGGSKASQGLLGMQALKMMEPQQPPQQHLGAPAMAGQTAPLPLPYGTPAGNSLGTNMQSLTEEQKRKLRMMGIQV